ncbi:UNVERIFIED_CONTAM: hypothetical protein FKN15_003207 [Acipenser sinensis]
MNQVPPGRLQIEGVPCTVLVGTDSSVTLVWPDINQRTAGSQQHHLEPTNVPYCELQQSRTLVSWGGLSLADREPAGPAEGASLVRWRSKPCSDYPRMAQSGV